MMKIFLIILILILAVVVYLGLPLYRAIKLSKVIEETAVRYEQHPNNSTMHILVTGDSTVVGTGAGNPASSTAGRLGHDFPQSDVTNLSENGLKIEGLQTKLNAITDKHFGLIVIQIGANDVVGMTSLSKIESGISGILDFATAHGDKVVVLTSGNIGLSPTFKFPISWLMTRRSLAVRAIYMKQVADRASTHDIHYVDLFKDKEHDIFNTDINKYYAIDRFHPSADGYAVWYEGIKNAMGK